MKKIYFILFTLLLMLCLVGCGGPDTPSTGDDNNTPSTGDENDTPSTGDEDDTPSTGDETPKKYIVKFIDENDELLSEKELQENEIPSYSYQVNDTEEWDYTFEGWSLEKNGVVLSSLPKLTENSTYYAVVSKVKKVYSITFDTTGGSEVNTIEAEYGSMIEKPVNPTRDKYNFMGWSTSKEEVNEVKWPIELTSNTVVYAVWTERIDIKSYLNVLINDLVLSPESYIPDSMLADNVSKHVKADEVDYDLTKNTNVSDIKYGGFGDQWNMVLTNIEQSQVFYNVLTISENIINSSVIIFNNYLDNNIYNTASHKIDNLEYIASIDFKDDVLKYTIQLKTNIDIPLIGEVLPQIHMELNAKTYEKSVRIKLNDNNAILYNVTKNSYAFYIKYGIDSLSRTAKFYVTRNGNEVNGSIYEFISLSGSDVVASSAEFYIDNEYVSVVGNKANQIVAFKGYINELYSVSTGNLLGYEVRETLTIASVTTQYNTLWFNLNEFSGIESIKVIENDNNLSSTGVRNPHDVYLNNSLDIFKPKYNKILTVETSRKYDIELRNQFFYGYVDEKLVEYKTEIPMLFVQEEDLDDLVDYLDSYNDISTEFTLAKKYIQKIQEDYDTLIDIFIEHKDNVTSEMINQEIGNSIDLGN